MISGLFDINSFLILAPHPDDESMGCSGTTVLLNEKGASSAIVFITNGERLHGKESSMIAQKRRKEAQSSCKLLGCDEVIFFDIPDGYVTENEALLYEKLLEVINLKKPDMVFSPSPLDYHHDHISVSNVSLRLHRKLSSFGLAFYEIYSTVRFSHLIDISSVIEKKKDIIMNYHTSLYETPEVYVHATLGLNAQRSIFTQKKGYYEAFYVIKESVSDNDLMKWLTYSP